MPTPNPALADLARLLQTSDGFEGLSETERSQFIDQMTVMDLDDGHVLIRQDGVVDTLYVVIAGVLAVSAVDRHGAAHSLGELGPGALTGAMNLFSHFPSATTVVARGPVRLAALSRSGFDCFLDACPAAAFALTEALRPRLRRARLWTALHLSEMFAQLDRDGADGSRIRLRARAAVRRRTALQAGGRRPTASTSWSAAGCEW